MEEGSPPHPPPLPFQSPSNYANRQKKNTMIRRTAVRETSVSRHHEGSIEGSGISEHYGIEGFKGGLNLIPILPRKAGRCNFSRYDRCHVIVCSKLFLNWYTKMLHTEKYFRNLINQTEIRLYLPFSE